MQTLPPKSFRLDLNPVRGASLLIVMGAILLSLLTSLLARYGFDFGAWEIAMTHADCFALTLLIFCVPIALVIDKGLAYYDFRRRTRWIVLCGLGVALALTTLLGPSPVDHTIGQPLPPRAKLLNARAFATSAGGGEEYWYVQFRIDPEALESLMASAGFTRTPLDDDPESARYEVRSFGSQSLFALPIRDVAHPRFYTRTWEAPYDGTTLLYDPATQTAHAKRIRG